MSAPLLVADSGPLIALARLDLRTLPAHSFTELLVPAIVWKEVTREPPPSEDAAFRRALDATSLRVPSPVVETLPGSTAPRRDAGERSAIAPALQHQGTLLIDERRGRAAASTLGLQVIGTLGLLVRARDAGLIACLRPLTDALSTSGYFLARPLVDRALAAVGESLAPRWRGCFHR